MAEDKRYSLLRKCVNNDGKEFYNIVPRLKNVKTFQSTDIKPGAVGIRATILCVTTLSIMALSTSIDKNDIDILTKTNSDIL